MSLKFTRQSKIYPASLNIKIIKSKVIPWKENSKDIPHSMIPLCKINVCKNTIFKIPFNLALKGTTSREKASTTPEKIKWSRANPRNTVRFWNNPEVVNPSNRLCPHPLKSSHSKRNWVWDHSGILNNLTLVTRICLKVREKTWPMRKQLFKKRVWQSSRFQGSRATN